jgi:hypothetical protein
MQLIMMKEKLHDCDPDIIQFLKRKLNLKRVLNKALKKSFLNHGTILLAYCLMFKCKVLQILKLLNLFLFRKVERMQNEVPCHCVVRKYQATRATGTQSALHKLCLFYSHKSRSKVARRTHGYTRKLSEKCLSNFTCVSQRPTTKVWTCQRDHTFTTQRCLREAVLKFKIER